MHKRMRQKASTLLLTVVLAGGALAILAGLGRRGDLVQALRAFPPWYLAPALLLAALNYILRFARWHLYLQECRVETGMCRSAAVFFSGLAMSVTPGKFGELFKSALLKQSDDVPVSLSAPIVVVERLMDLTAVAGLASLGAAYYSIGRAAVVGAGVLILAVVVPLAASPSLATALASWLARRRMVARMTGADGLAADSVGPAGGLQVRGGAAAAVSGAAIDRAATVFSRLLKGRPLLIGLVFGGLAWLAECAALYVVLSGLGEHLTPPAAVFVYLLATLAGALSFLPGGLGAAEASMAGLLIGFGVPAGGAAAATIIVRACTLWFAVVVGVGGYAWYRVLLQGAFNEAAPRKSAAGSGRAAEAPR